MRRLAEAALKAIGQPLPAADRARLDLALNSADGHAAVRAIQEVLDPHCLIGIKINPESRVKAIQGPAAARLIQHGWRSSWSRSTTRPA